MTDRTIQQSLDLAVQHHSAGRLPEAEGIYRQILQADPNQPVALHLLGVIAHQAGKNDIAVGLIGKALAINSDYAEAHNNLGLALQEQGNLDDAVASYRKALAIKPEFAEAHYNLGNAFLGQGKLDEAVASYRMALAIKPNYAEAHANMANCLMQQNLFYEAIESYLMVITIDPSTPENYHHIGRAYRELDRSGEARAILRQGLVSCDGPHADVTEIIKLKIALADLDFDSGHLEQAKSSLADAFPHMTEHIQDCKVLRFDDLENYCTKSKMTYERFESLPLTSDNEDIQLGEKHLFIAELKNCGLLGDFYLPMTRSGQVFIDQLIFDEDAIFWNRHSRNCTGVVLGDDKRIVVVNTSEQKYYGPHVLLGNISMYFGHWLMNYLSRLMLIEGHEELKSAPIVVGNDINKRQLECLRRIGVSDDRIVRINRGQIAWFETLWVPSMPMFTVKNTRKAIWTPELISYLRQSFRIPDVHVTDKPRRRLFVSRRNAIARRLLNEDEIFEALGHYGFESIDPADHTIEEQISLSSESEIILGPAGSGMCMALFAPQSTEVVELRGGKPTAHTSRDHVKACGQNYHCVFGVTVGPKDRENLNNFWMPVEKVVRKVEQIAVKLNHGEFRS